MHSFILLSNPTSMNIDRFSFPTTSRKRKRVTKGLPLPDVLSPFRRCFTTNGFDVKAVVFDGCDDGDDGDVAAVDDDCDDADVNDFLCFFDCPVETLNTCNNLV